MVYYGLFLYIFYCVYKLVLQLNYYFFPKEIAQG